MVSSRIPRCLPTLVAIGLLSATLTACAPQAPSFTEPVRPGASVEDEAPSEAVAADPTQGCPGLPFAEAMMAATGGGAQPTFAGDRVGGINFSCRIEGRPDSASPYGRDSFITVGYKRLSALPCAVSGNDELGGAYGTANHGYLRYDVCSPTAAEITIVYYSGLDSLDKDLETVRAIARMAIDHEEEFLAVGEWALD